MTPDLTDAGTTECPVSKALDRRMPWEAPWPPILRWFLFLVHRSIGFGDRPCVVRSLQNYPTQKERHKTQYGI